MIRVVTDWQQHFASYRDDVRLDSSSDAFWHGTQAIALQFAGPMVGRTVLDMACGTGRLALAAAALGASSVVGTEMADAIDGLQRQHGSRCAWLAADLADPSTYPALTFDVVLCVESLYYVADPGLALWRMWDLVSPGGRMVAIVGNARSLLVEKARVDYGGAYRGMHPGALDAIGKNLAGCSRFDVVGMFIDPEQRLVPFQLDEPDRPGQPAHRLVFVAER